MDCEISDVKLESPIRWDSIGPRTLYLILATSFHFSSFTLAPRPNVVVAYSLTAEVIAGGE